jgi:hypothetical protein
MSGVASKINFWLVAGSTRAREVTNLRLVSLALGAHLLKEGFAQAVEQQSPVHPV